MVAYSFRPRFVEPIRAGSKRQTIRAERKRHARPGEEVQLYSGMRTRNCFLIGRATCELVEDIRIDVERGEIAIADEGAFDLGPMSDEACEFQAGCDGFSAWAETQAFWRKHHPRTPMFSGVLIRWGKLL